MQHKAYFVNSTVLASDIGNALALKGIDQGISYAIVGSYNPKYKGWGFSLRSLHGTRDGAADVSLIAGKYGGGGHRAAAGMAADVADVEDMFVQGQ